MARPTTDDGNEVDANFAVEGSAGRIDVVLESRGGSDHGPHASRNSQYSLGLRLLLERLALHGATIDEIQVASSLAERKPEAERRIYPEGYPLPIDLQTIPDYEALRLAIGRATGEYGKAPGEKAGTYSKRIRLRTTCGAFANISAEAVEDLLAKPDIWTGRATSDPEDLRKQVEQVIARAEMLPELPPPPGGSANVPSTTSSAHRFVRSPDVVAWVLLQADGCCEVCGSPAPFNRDDGTGFLEVHHVTTLADGGPDTVDNAVACCPNCHRELHHGADRDAIRFRLIKAITRLTEY